MKIVTTETSQNHVQFSFSIENVCNQCGFPLDCIDLEGTEDNDVIRISVHKCKTCTEKMAKETRAFIKTVRGYLDGDQEITADCLQAMTTDFEKVMHEFLL